MLHFCSVAPARVDPTRKRSILDWLKDVDYITTTSEAQSNDMLLETYENYMWTGRSSNTIVDRAEVLSAWEALLRRSQLAADTEDTVTFLRKLNAALAKMRHGVSARGFREHEGCHAVVHEMMREVEAAGAHRHDDITWSVLARLYCRLQLPGKEFFGEMDEERVKALDLRSLATLLTCGARIRAPAPPGTYSIVLRRLRDSVGELNALDVREVYNALLILRPNPPEGEAVRMQQRVVQKLSPEIAALDPVLVDPEDWEELAVALEEKLGVPPEEREQHRHHFMQ